MIEINNVTKKYGSYTAFVSINCAVGSGSILGLVGNNGAGKTTLLKTICGILKPEYGNITLDGVDIYDNAKAKSRIFLVPDDFYFLPQANMKRMARFFRGYYPYWSGAVFDKLTSIFGLDPDKRLSSFSKGMQRQAYIIFALSALPDYLLLDEAFDGIDPLKRDMVRQLLLEAISERGMSVILSSHNLRELEDLCDRICLINGKRLVYDACIEDMRTNKNKFRAAFNGDVDVEAFLCELDIPYRDFKRDGKIITFIAYGPAEEITSRLTGKNPLLLETLPMTLEEIFLIEMEAKTYDFKDLFK